MFVRPVTKKSITTCRRLLTSPSKPAPKGWEKKSCESCHGPGAKHAESASAKRYWNQPTCAARNRSYLPHLPFEPTNARRPDRQRPRQGSSGMRCFLIRTWNRRRQTGGAPNSKINTLCSTCHISEWAAFGTGRTSTAFQRAPCRAWIATILTRRSARMPCEPLSVMNPDASPATAINAGLLFSNMRQCGWKVVAHAMSRTAQRTRNAGASRTEPSMSRVPLQYFRTQSAERKAGRRSTRVHDLRTARFQNCTVCHVKVHGSYVDRELLR